MKQMNIKLPWPTGSLCPLATLRARLTSFHSRSFLPTRAFDLFHSRSSLPMRVRPLPTRVRLFPRASTSFHSRSFLPTRAFDLFHSRLSLPMRVRPLSIHVRLFPLAFVSSQARSTSFHSRSSLSTRVRTFVSFHSRSSLPTRIRLYFSLVFVFVYVSSHASSYSILGSWVWSSLEYAEVTFWWVWSALLVVNYLRALALHTACMVCLLYTPLTVELPRRYSLPCHHVLHYVGRTKLTQKLLPLQ